MTTVAHTVPTTGSIERHLVEGVSPKHVAELIAVATNQVAIWTGKVRAEWHITDKRTNKITAIVR